MEGRAKSFSAYGAAAVLAAVTLGVFYRLQDYGPESAIRRFHSDVLNTDPIDLQRVTVQPIGSRRARELESIVSGQLDSGSTYQLLRMDRSPDQVRAAVLYRRPDGQNSAMIWVVERSDRTWRVNVDKTMTIIEDWGRRG